MTKYISDKYVTVGLTGIRWVSKKDTNWNGKNSYYLEIGYKGQIKTVDYDGDCTTRDFTYNRISDSLEGVQK